MLRLPRARRRGQSWSFEIPVEQLHPVEIRPRNDFRLWVRFNDGSEGEIDLSARAGRGVFKIWDDPGVFESAAISPHRTIRWSDDAELCADAVYLEITGRAAEEIMPGLRALADA